MISADVKISKKVAQSTALSVINCHRSGSTLPSTHLEDRIHQSGSQQRSNSNFVGPKLHLNNHVGEC